MSKLDIKKVLALPGTLGSDTLYLVKNASGELEIHLSTADGTQSINVPSKSEILNDIAVKSATQPPLPNDSPIWVDTISGLLYVQQEIEGVATWVPTTAEGVVSFENIQNLPTTRDDFGITDVPKSDGTDASGTWNISISGNADTATTANSAANATTATNVSGGTVNATTGTFSDEVTAASFNSITGLSSTTPVINGTAAVGTGTTVARADHVHPTDTTRAVVGQTMYIGTTAFTINRASGAIALTGITSIDGLAATATKLASARTIGLNSLADSATAVSFDASANITLPVPGVYSNITTTLDTGVSWYGNSMGMVNASDGPGGYGWYRFIQMSYNDIASNVWQSQIALNHDTMYYRSRQGGVIDTAGWNSWVSVLTSGNYNSHVPTLTGTGATGTWGINITGSADFLGGVHFDNVMKKNRWRIHPDDNTSLNTSITGSEIGFTYGGTGEAQGPFISFGGLNSTGDYVCQLVGNYGTGSLFNIRTRNGDTNSWNPWRTLLHDANYQQYSPALNGNGASGTWGINITGNATTATALPESNSGYGDAEVIPRNKGGYGGLHFATSNKTFMTQTTGVSAGMYRDSGGWDWYFDTNGILQEGVVPWTSVTSRPTALSAFSNDTGFITSGNSIAGSAGYLDGHTKDYFVYGDGNNLGSINTYLGNGGAGADTISRSCFFRDNGSHFSALGIHIQHATNPEYAVQLGTSYDGIGWIARAKQNGAWGQPTTFLTDTNYNSYVPNLTGTGASGNWNININGNAATTSQNSWTDLTTTNRLVAMGSQATTINTGVGALGGIEVRGSGGETAAFMAFHRPGYFAAYFGVDNDNQWKVGGWSMGGVSHALLHTGNYNSWVPTLTGNNASGTWGINISGFAESMGPRPSVYGASDAYTAFQNTRSHTRTWDERYGQGGPNGGWNFIENMRHSNDNNYWGRQNAWGWEDNACELYSRNISAGNVGSWVRFLNTNNFNNYAPTLTGAGASGSWNITAAAVPYSGITGKPDAPMYYQGFNLDADNMGTSGSGFTYAVNAPFVGPVVRFASQSTAGGYDLQLNASYQTGDYLAFRVRNGDSGAWNAWRRCLTDADYTSFPGHIRSLGDWGSQDFNTLGNTTNSIYSGYTANCANRPPAQYDYGTVLSMGGFEGGGSGKAQIYISHSGNDLVFRGGWNNDSWQSWNRVLTHLNYGNWVPSLTGAGASGTWNINIAGRGHPRKSDGTDINFHWSGFGGQPEWLWGGYDGINMYVYNPSNFSVNYANSAGILNTTRNINGTSFNGSIDITTANWGTARNITVGTTSKSVNGSGDVSWSHGEIGIPYDLSGGVIGLYPANATIFAHVTARPFYLPAGLTGSIAISEAAASGAISFTIYKNGVSIGAINFAAGATSGSFSFTSTVTFVFGDKIKIMSPAADATLSDFMFNLLGAVS